MPMPLADMSEAKRRAKYQGLQQLIKMMQTLEDKEEETGVDTPESSVMEHVEDVLEPSDEDEGKEAGEKRALTEDEEELEEEKKNFMQRAGGRGAPPRGRGKMVIAIEEKARPFAKGKKGA